MKNFKVFDWLLILGLLGALVVAAVVVMSQIRGGGDDIAAQNAAVLEGLEGLPPDAYAAISAELDEINQEAIAAERPPMEILYTYRGDNSWCVVIYRIYDGMQSLVIAYPDSEQRAYIRPQAAHGCDAPPN